MATTLPLPCPSPLLLASPFWLPTLPLLFPLCFLVRLALLPFGSFQVGCCGRALAAPPGPNRDPFRPMIEHLFQKPPQRLQTGSPLSCSYPAGPLRDSSPFQGSPSPWSSRLPLLSSGSVQVGCCGRALGAPSSPNHDPFHPMVEYCPFQKPLQGLQVGPSLVICTNHVILVLHNTQLYTISL